MDSPEGGFGTQSSGRILESLRLEFDPKEFQLCTGRVSETIMLMQGT